MQVSQRLNNRYEVIRELGDGGFGKTFLVKDLQMPSARQCVVKQLKPLHENGEIYAMVQERFQREAAILEQLGEHDQVPRLYAYFCEADLFYLVEEYVEGDTLTQKVQREGAQSEAIVTAMLVNLLPAIVHVHQQKIVHRDIKPDNILLRQSDQKPVLIDFGAVKETMATVLNAQGDSSRSIVVGTPGYMPSEQMVGRPVYGSDLYSLGLTAIYMLTGKLPQELDTDPQTGAFLWRGYAPLVSAGLAAVLDRAIQISPGSRFGSAQEMFMALNGLAVGVTMPPNGVQNLQYSATIISDTPTYATGMPTQAVMPPFQPVSPMVAPNSLIQPQPGMNDWTKIMLLLGLIGSFILAGLFIVRPQQAASNSSKESRKDQVDPLVSATSDQKASPVNKSVSVSTSGNTGKTVLQQELEAAAAKPASPIKTSTKSQGVEQTDPVKFIQEHYADLNKRNYQKTWTDLSPGFKARSKGFEGYTDWWDSVEYIDVLSVQSVSQRQNSAVVAPSLRYRMKDGRVADDTKDQIYLEWNAQENHWDIVDKASA
jgi:serine/threonine protein kinase, bacterial